jgi:hypothetical protein
MPCCQSPGFQLLYAVLALAVGLLLIIKLGRMLTLLWRHEHRQLDARAPIVQGVNMQVIEEHAVFMPAIIAEMAFAVCDDNFDNSVRLARQVTMITIVHVVPLDGETIAIGASE